MSNVKRPDRREKIRSFILQESALFFNENWKEKGLFLTVFDVVVSPDLEEARFVITFNQQLKNKKEIYNKVNKLLQEFRSILFKKSDFRKMPKFTCLISDETAFKGLNI